MSDPSLNSFKQAAHFHEGRVSPLVLIVLHATAGLENASGLAAEGVQSMFADPNSRVASAHATCDQNSTAGSVHMKDTAFGAVHANACGYHIEQVGLANQTKQQWHDEISTATVRRAAYVAWQVAALTRIKLVWLNDDQVFRVLHDPQCGITGLTDHATVERVMPSTGHTDPGKFYALDTFFGELARLGSPSPRPLHHNPYPKPDYTHFPIRQGGVGSPVQWVQWALQRDPTGRFDAGLTAAVKASQRKWLPGTVPDGIVGKQTGDLFTRFTH